MQLKIKTNFTDLWHSAFDSEGEEFRLMNNEGPSRIEMMDIFHKIGLETPLFGQYDDFLAKNYPENKKVVIYDDIYMHFGEGKRVLRFSELENEDKSKYLCEFIEICPTLFTNYKSKSTRYLFVGDVGFHYNYFSFEDWRSNWGEGYISPPIQMTELPEWRHQLPYAFFAIDFVGEPYCLKAIDLNISPGVDKKLHKIISPGQMVSCIKEFLERKNGPIS